ncbi:MAG: NAD(P)-binding domain-containing protein, partial [Bacteroidota bacterium]
MKGNTTYRFGVLGSGSWATALVKILSENLEQVNWYIRSAESLHHVEEFGHNPKYLQSATFPKNKLHLFNDLEHFIKTSDIIITAIPAAFLHDSLKTVNPQHFIGKSVISA